MRTITWNFSHELKTEHTNWSVLSIKPAFEKIQRYWNVNFVQVNKNPQLQIVLTNRRNGNASMWQSRKTIYVPAHYKWLTQGFMSQALIHEFGHWLVNGGGHNKDDKSIMHAVLMYDKINFQQTDMKWFGSLPWKNELRPWHENNYWMQQNLKVSTLFSLPVYTEVPCGTCKVRPVRILIDIFNDFFRKKKLYEVP